MESRRMASRRRVRLPTPTYLSTELRPPAGELPLQTGHDRAVHLADAAFGEIERGADLLHRQLFVVIQDDDQPLVAIEPLGDQPHQIVFLNAASGVLALFVLENIDLANVLVTVGLIPFLVEADEVDRA